jgi:hypothetical protein
VAAARRVSTKRLNSCIAPQREPLLAFARLLLMMRYLRLGLLVGSLVLYVRWFDPKEVQWLVHMLWLLAVGLWVIEVRHLSGGRLLNLSIGRAEVAPIVVTLIIFAACWLPFYNNWRWACTGDSIGWYGTGWNASHTGVRQNILSVQGVDNNFTYLHTIAASGLMFVFKPTLFWHRVGKLVFSCLSLAAIYTYFALMLGRFWSIAIVVGTAVNYVWLWFSYVSYGHIDSHICYFMTLTFAVLTWRAPDRLSNWMFCGLIAGVSLFFTQTAWSAVAAAGVVLGVFALATRRFGALAVYAITFLLVATPMWLQFTGFLHMATGQTKSIYEWHYLTRIFGMILWLPYDSPIRGLGVDGAFLRAPMGSLYVAGVPLAALGVIPAIRRWLRLPVVAPLVFALLLWDTVLMTLTNNGYDMPSTKRCYNLIPLQVFFAVLPAYLLYAWVGGSRWLGRATQGLVAGVLGVYTVANIQLLMHPKPRIYGANIFDGFIELRQRFPDRRVLFLTTKEEHRTALAPDGLFNDSYKLLDQLTIDSAFDDSTVERACSQRLLLCYEPNWDRERWRPLSTKYARQLQPFPLLNTTELDCYDCTSTPPPGDGATAG